MRRAIDPLPDGGVDMLNRRGLRGGAHQVIHINVGATNRAQAVREIRRVQRVGCHRHHVVAQTHQPAARLEQRPRLVLAVNTDVEPSAVCHAARLNRAMSPAALDGLRWCMASATITTRAPLTRLQLITLRDQIRRSNGVFRRVIVLCDCAALAPLAENVDDLARLEIEVRRCGATLLLEHGSDALLELIAFMGLAGVLRS